MTAPFFSFVLGAEDVLLIYSPLEGKYYISLTSDELTWGIYFFKHFTLRAVSSIHTTLGNFLYSYLYFHMLHCQHNASQTHRLKIFC